MSKAQAAFTGWQASTILKRICLFSFFALIPLPLLAQETGVAISSATQTGVLFGWGITLLGALTALGFARKFFNWMVKQDPGNETMVKIAGHVRDGANAYLMRQYRVVAIFFAVTCALLIIVAFGFNAQSKIVPIAFLSGGFFSGLAGWCGMKTATLASSRTAQACQTSLNSGLQVAFRSGAVMGLTVVGLGLLDICMWFAILYWGFDAMGMPLLLEEITVTMLCCVMGASSQALFARVGGGIFTKAADVGADLVGKNEQDIPEDDPRNPATIADNVGDNVGDVAGMGADLYESYCGSILAAAALGVAAYQGHHEMQLMMLLLPMVLASLGIFLSIMGIHFVRTDENADQKQLLHALGFGINSSSLAVAAVAGLAVYMMLVKPSQLMDLGDLRTGNQLFGVFFAILSGLASGVIIGWWTEYSTSDVYPPTRRIADQTLSGPATVIIAGVAEGMYSVWVPIVVIGTAILISFGSCTGFVFNDPALYAIGLYGVAIAAVGMLSTLGITLATDAYGPIADNAGGNAEMSHLDPEVRKKTDALDSLGNTTAATGKGFAIGSAALTALALMAAYVEQVRVGFNRWGEDAVVAETIEATETNALILSSGFIATRDEGAEENRLFLAYTPSSPVQRELAAPLLGSDVRAGETVVVDLPELVRQGVIVDVSKATIPDFVRYYDITVMNPKVLVGVFMGVMLAFVFCALTMKAVGRSADEMVQEVRRQFDEIVGLKEGTAEPDYAACVDISTTAALREMKVPAVLGLVVPVFVGMILGVGGVMGMLAGGLTSGFAVAVMMSNAGGAWDNAKKYIETGAHGGKGTDAHKASVVGDTVGDPFKDTSGPSLNILIKLISMVSVVFAGMIVQYALRF